MRYGTMAIDAKVKHVVVMCCIWFIVMAATALYLIDDSAEKLFVIFIMMLISGVFQFLGATVYSGDYRGIAGFSHMTDAHIAEYESKHDVDGMCKFLGISLTVSSYLFFFAYIISREFLGELWGILLSVMLLTVLIIAVSICSAGKRFKIDRNENDVK